MKYLCLGYQAERSCKPLSEGERKSLDELSSDFQNLLQKNGHLIENLAIQSGSTATTLRFENGMMSVAAGSISEFTEQMVALLVIEAKDLNVAIQLMSRLPSMQFGGCLEIRPIDEAPSKGDKP